MTLEVHIWKDGSVSVTRNGNLYNRFSEASYDDCLIVEIEEPTGSD